MPELQIMNKTLINHRKAFGQFFTPPPVASIMAQWVLSNDPETILDPAFGLGVFYHEVKKLRSSRKLRFTGYEIDEKILDNFDGEKHRDDLFLRNEDYLAANSGKYDGIICNPPYFRFQKFLNRHNVLPQIEKQIGRKLAGYTNISSVFLVKALNELNNNGNLAFIMPFEFFNTGYGEEIKKSLLQNNLLKQIIVFSNEKDIFPEATTTVCVLLCSKDNQQADIKIAKIQSVEELASIENVCDYYQKTIQPCDLPPEKKWTPIITSLFSENFVPESFVKLSFYGSFSRGIATGANEFFALNKAKILKLGIDQKNLCKCVTRSAQIRKPVFSDEDFENLYCADKPVFCLNVADANDHKVKKYLSEGEKSGFNQRYLTSKRSPWYRIEKRNPAPILIGVFNRGRLKVIRNLTDAVNFTCFHCFIPNIRGRKTVNKIFVYFLSDLGQKTIKMNRRCYGNNLDKFEPGDLNESLCPNEDQFGKIDDSEAEKVIEMAKTDEESAIKYSNDLIQRILFHKDRNALEKKF
ncbi:MAG: N-6 DNA methylase [Candidatus Rifleibacteriota bacterium]